jgi:hypothetical protein
LQFAVTVAHIEDLWQHLKRKGRWNRCRNWSLDVKPRFSLSFRFWHCGLSRLLLAIANAPKKETDS